MNDVERALKKFRESPSPVIFTPAEYQAFTSFYGAVQPNNYEDPFMGKVIEVREPEFTLEEPVLLEGEYEPEIAPHFVPPAEVDEEILPPPVDEFAAEDLPRYEDQEEEIAENPYA